MFSDFIYAAKSAGEDAQAGAGCGALDQVAKHGQAFEEQPLKLAGHVRKQAMVNGIELRAAGRIVGDLDQEVGRIHHALQLLFEHQAVDAVAAAAVAQEQHSGRLRITDAAIVAPPVDQSVGRKLAGIVTVAQMHVSLVKRQIIQPMRNHHAGTLRREVVIPASQGRAAKDTAGPHVIAQHFPLFRVHREDRHADFEAFSLQLRDVPELRVAVRIVLHALGFLRLSLPELEFFQQPIDDRHAHFEALLRQSGRDLAARKIRPQHAFLHGVARSVCVHHRDKRPAKLRRASKAALTSPLFFESVPAGAQAGCPTLVLRGGWSLHRSQAIEKYTPSRHDPIWMPPPQRNAAVPAHSTIDITPSSAVQHVVDKQSHTSYTFPIMIKPSLYYNHSGKLFNSGSLLLNW